MKRKYLIVILGTLIFAQGCEPFFTPENSGEELPVEVHDFAVEFTQLTNNHRESLGLNPLLWDQGTYEVALAHSQDMQTLDYFSHTNLEGESPFDRLANANISYSYAGENIAMGYTSPSEVLNGWLNSPGHKANIENPNYTHHGVGYVPDGHYWTHVFLKPTRE